MTSESRESGFSTEGERAFEYSGTDHETVVETILDAASAVTDAPVLPSEASDGDREPLPPLYDAIDTDALVRLSPDSACEDAYWRVTFSYAGCDVTVTSAGTVVVSE